jgi:hypothetical protein
MLSGWCPLQSQFHASVPFFQLIGSFPVTVQRGYAAGLRFGYHDLDDVMVRVW